MVGHIPESELDWQPILGPAILADRECRDLSAALRCRPRTAIRLRPGLTPNDFPEFRLSPVPWHPRTYFVDEISPAGSAVSQFPGFFLGLYYVQDAGSLLSVRLAGVRPGNTVCDVCAAPGGKSTALLEEMGEEGWLLANEALADRMPALRFNLYRHGAGRYLLAHKDPQPLAELLLAQFDVVVVDVPCSGQSLVSRSRQTESAFDVAHIEFCAARQRRILEASARLVRPGGCLVYSTCTFSYQENEGVLCAFLSDHGEWQPEAEPELTAWQSPLMPGAYRVWPHRDGCAGAFAAKLRLVSSPREQAESHYAASVRSSLDVLSDVPEESRDWGHPTGPLFVWRQEWQIFATVEPPPPSFSSVICGGPEFAFTKGKSLFPAYALAMRHDGCWVPRQTVPLDRRGLADYVRGKPIRAAVKGWAVATADGYPVGWLKGDGRVAKNHLPKAGRFTAPRPLPWV